MEQMNIYLLSLLASALCGCGLYAYSAGRAGYKARTLWLPPLLALFCCLLFARLFYFTAHIELILSGFGWASFFNFNIRGLTFGGALIGLLFSGLISAKLLQKPVHQMLDLMAPAGLLILGLARLGEFFVDFGQGSYVENPLLQFFPLSVKNHWDEWYYAIFMLEALFALAALLYILKKRPAKPGALWQTSLIFILGSQIFCESLRAETLRLGFVRVHQLFCALGLAALLIHYIRLANRVGRHLGRLLYLPALLALGVALIIGIEFALDKLQEIPNPLLYTVMALTVILIVLTVHKAGRLAKGAAAQVSGEQGGAS